MPYELHPDLPAEGRAIQEGGRLSATLEDIGRQCAAVGMDFVPPRHVPNSRRALATAEVVRATAPECFAAFDEAVFRAYFVDGRDIADGRVLNQLVTDAGARADEVSALVDAGHGVDAVDASKTTAHEYGVTATPAWLFDSGFVLPGVQPPELFERVVKRLGDRN